MRKKQLELLKNLISMPSPSGFEYNIAKYIYSELLKYLPKSKIYIDNYYNVIVTIEGQLKKSIMIDSHQDQIGYICTNIDKDGLISIQHIGGSDNQIISARNLNIITEKGIIKAVVNRKHSHLVSDEDDIKVDKIQYAQVDIGIRGRKRVSQKIKIGDPVVYEPKLELLSSDKNLGTYLSGYGFDDKSGCFILIEAIKEIIRSKKSPQYTLIFTFSSQEETGKTKVKSLVSEYRPELFIEVDVTFATDYEDDELDKEVGKCELGKGVVLYRGVDIHKDTLDLIIDIANKNKIKIQHQASTGNIGYTATEISDLCNRILILGIPLRNMHTPVEIINTKDLKYGIQLLKNFCLSKELKKIFNKKFQQKEQK